MRQDENATRHANRTHDNIRVCAYAHFKADGEKVTGDEQPVKQPSIGHAWVEYASATTTSPYGYLYAYWSVPPAPSTNDGQTVHLFPGMEDYKDVVTIIRPVLGGTPITLSVGYRQLELRRERNCLGGPADESQFRRYHRRLSVRHRCCGNTVLRHVGHRYLGSDIGELLSAGQYLKSGADFQLGLCRRSGGV